MCHGAFDNKCWRENFDGFGLGWSSLHSCSWSKDEGPVDGPQWNDGPQWTAYHKRPTEVDNCEGLARYFAALNATYEGNEAFLISEGLCRQFWNTIIMRN